MLLRWRFSTNIAKKTKIRRCCRDPTTDFRIKRFHKTKISKLFSHLGQPNNFTAEIDFSCWTLGKWCEIHLTKVNGCKPCATSLIGFSIYCFYLFQVYSVALRVSVAECCVSLCCCLVFVVSHCIGFAFCYILLHYTEVW